MIVAYWYLEQKLYIQLHIFANIFNIVNILLNI